MASDLRHDPALHAHFRRARALGFVGPLEPEALIEHALGFAARVVSPARAVDLGSGAGVPGLVLARLWPTSRWLLVEAGARRAAFLDGAVHQLGLEARVEVGEGPAEVLARGSWRGTADLVVARAFAAPGVTAECAVGFLAPGGTLVVSEPPEDDGRRWAGVSTTDLGLRPEDRWTTPAGTYQRLRQERPCPERYPRRPGVPAKRPLF